MEGNASFWMALGWVDGAHPRGCRAGPSLAALSSRDARVPRGEVAREERAAHERGAGVGARAPARPAETPRAVSAPLPSAGLASRPAARAGNSGVGCAEGTSTSTLPSGLSSTTLPPSPPAAPESDAAGCAAAVSVGLNPVRSALARVAGVLVEGCHLGIAVARAAPVIAQAPLARTVALNGDFLRRSASRRTRGRQGSSETRSRREPHAAVLLQMAVVRLSRLALRGRASTGPRRPSRRVAEARATPPCPVSSSGGPLGRSRVDSTWRTPPRAPYANASVGAKPRG